MNIADVPQLEMYLNTKTSIIHLVLPGNPWLDDDHNPLALCGASVHDSMEQKTALEVMELLRRTHDGRAWVESKTRVCRTCRRSGAFKGMQALVKMQAKSWSGALRNVILNPAGDL